MRILKIILIIISIFASNSSLGQLNDSIKNTIAENLKALEYFKGNIQEFIGKELPKFELTLLNGNKLNSESLKGKPTLINFWFSNCQPCIDEMPILNEIRSQFDQDVNFISITFQDQKEVTEFLKRIDFDFTHIIDSKEYLKSFGFIGYPKTLTLDKNLIITEIEKNIPKDIETEMINKAEFKNRIVSQLTELKKR